MKLKYPKGEQNFKKIRENGSVYIDKTELIYELVKNESYVFLARPRRFGKSLLLSTIQAYFEGKKELFEGLAIEKLEKEWKEYPVFHLELARVNSSDPLSLKNHLDLQLLNFEREFGITQTTEDISARFGYLIKETYDKTGERVVILIDEYDNPLINTLTNHEIHERNRNLLKSVYSNLKAMDEYIQFAMLTGVSRFSKMTVFSGLNNLTDITFYDRYAAICGFTIEEIRKYLSAGIVELAQNEDWDYEEAVLKLKEAYDGYHFSKRCPDIYNPYSVILALDKGETGSFWMETATPTFIVETLKASSVPFTSIFQSEAKESALAESDTSFRSPLALLFQTGYLTIKGFDKEKKKYELGIPNREVEESLFPYLLTAFTGVDMTLQDNLTEDMRDCLSEGDVEKFLGFLKTYIADIPTFSSEKKISERDFEHTLYLIFKTLGFDIQSQRSTSYSRMDLVLKTQKHIYIFELKISGSSREALDQISDKEYALPFKFDGRKIFKIGLVFSKEKRNIIDWKIEEAD